MKDRPQPPNMPTLGGMGRYGAIPVIRDTVNQADYPMAQAVPLRISNVEADFECPECEKNFAPEVLNQILVLCLWQQGGTFRMACPGCGVLGPELKVTP